MVKVPLSQKIYNTIPTMGILFVSTAITSTMLKFYTDFVGLNPVYFGIANLLTTFWGSINTLIFGYYLTRIRPKPGKGKFRKFMLITGPIMFLGFFLVVSMSPELPQLGMFQILIIGSFLYTTANIIFITSLGGIYANITDDLNERAKISTISSYFSTIPGAILGMVPLVFLSGDYPYDFLLTGFIILGVIGALIMLVGSYLIEERNEWYEDIPEPMSPFKAIKECVKAEGWIIHLVYQMCTLIPSAMFGVALVYYLGDVHRVYGFLAILPGLIGGGIQLIVFYPLILKIRKKIGTYKTMYLFESLKLIGYFGFFIAPNYLTMFIAYFCILTALSGTGLANGLAGTDVVDADMVRTGERRAPMFAGINGVLITPIGGIAVYIFTLILEITGYNAIPGAIQTPEALFGIRFGIGGISMFFLVIALIIWRFFPFQGERYRELRVIVEDKFRNTLEITEKDLE